MPIIDLKSRFHKILENNKHFPAKLVSNQLSFIVDSEYHKLFSVFPFQSLANKFCLVAIGGYGRRELSPFSDIDILYLHEGLTNEDLNEIINYFNNSFYNAGKDIGYACRTIEECKQYLDNLYSFNAILDSRFLLGEKLIYNVFESEILNNLPIEIIEEHREFTLNRMEALIGSDPPLHVSEPNLKNGPFGLRDIQNIYWIEKANKSISSFSGLGVLPIFHTGEIQLLENAYDFYLKIRNTLHHINGRKVDILNIPQQITVAKFLGFGENNDINSVDKLMRELYSHESEIYKFITLYLDYKKYYNVKMDEFYYEGLYLRKIHSKIYPDKHRQLFTDPGTLYKDILNIFLLCQENSLEPSPLLLGEIQFAGNFLEDNFANSEHAVKIFKKFISNQNNIGKILTKMHHCGVLAKLIPEFGECTNYSLFSYHHQYTIDEHTLLIMRELDKLRENIFEYKDIQKIYNKSFKTDILALAIIIHDAGKVKEGDHCQYGAELAVAIGERIGLSEDEISLFKFLVESHILMSELSSKRDISDPFLLNNFASIVADENRLNLLYILTIIDTKSVGKSVLNNWKRSNLSFLYEKTLEILQNDRKSPYYYTKESMNENLLVFLREKERLSQEEITLILKFKESFEPESYVRYFTPRKIFHHYQVYKALRTKLQNLQIEISHEPTFVVITIYHCDDKNFLSELTGCVCALSLNVIGMRTFKSEEGFFIEAIQVTDITGSKNITTQKLSLLNKYLHELHENKISVEDLLSSPLEWVSYNNIPEGMVEEIIEFDNTVSPDYTILEIKLPDSIGLLYRLIKVIISFDIQLHFVRVSTSADFAFDTFYLQDRTGLKITDSSKLATIRESLTNAKQEKTSTKIESIEF